MTGLDREKALVFHKDQSSSAALMTANSGIRMILPDSEICDFDFELCGYSMNSVEGAAVSTIHVTSTVLHSLFYALSIVMQQRKASSSSGLWLL